MFDHRHRPLFTARFNSMNEAFRSQLFSGRRSSPVMRLLFTVVLSVVFVSVAVIAVFAFLAMLTLFLVMRLYNSLRRLWSAPGDANAASSQSFGTAAHSHATDTSTFQQQRGRPRIIEVRAKPSRDAADPDA